MYFCTVQFMSIHHQRMSSAIVGCHYELQCLDNGCYVNYATGHRNSYMSLHDFITSFQASQDVCVVFGEKILISNHGL